MSSLTRRIQRAAPHKRTISLRTGGTIRVAVDGRNQSGTGIGSRLGVKNPKAKDLVARKAREQKWGR